MKKIENLLPSSVFHYFNEITKVPRPSKKEEKILKYLIVFAQNHNLAYKQDKVGNLLITKPASSGMEDAKTIILQSHVDMVCEKNGDITHNFETDPIITYIDGDWVRAKGTTLGADCGIGMAATLAVLADKNLTHPKIEALFTVDEETGLTGANALETGFLTGDILLNLDSEDDGELFIGCAGGMNTQILFTYTEDPVPSNYVAFSFRVKGLMGGHSGDDINKGRGNSIKLLNRFLWTANSRYDVRIYKYEGGNLHNAIPREAYAIFTVHRDSIGELNSYYSEFEKEIFNEYKFIEPNIEYKLGKVALPEYVIDETTQLELLNSICACPNGVISMSAQMPGLVESSTNLASIKFIENNQIRIVTSQRSDVDSRKKNISNTIKSLIQLTGASVIQGEGYPGWRPNKDSPILKVVSDTYKELFGEEAKVKAIHAGLECGLFLEKYPHLDMISFGPTIRNAHSPDECLYIPAVQKFWDLLVKILEHKL